MQIGFFGLLTIVFVTLKLIGYLDWSWWLVLAPMWLGLVVILVFLVIWGVVTSTGHGRIVFRKRK